MKIGVLALQGAFIEHIQTLQKLDVEAFEIRQPSDFDDCQDGLILPGGESTVIGKLLRELGLFEPIHEAIRGGLPVFGTCAGMVLLAQEIDGEEESYFGALDAVVRRNAYGRQLGSFSTVSAFEGIGEIPMVFIRAPYITSRQDGVEALSRVDGNIVAAKQGRILATSFHPELTGDTRVHEYFLNMK